MRKPSKFSLFGGTWKLQLKGDFISSTQNEDLHIGVDKARKLASWLWQTANYIEQNEERLAWAKKRGVRGATNLEASPLGDSGQR